MARYQKIISGFFADANVNPFHGWIGINGENIAEIRYTSRPKAQYCDELIEFDDSCLIMPGFVDTHVHCREPGAGQHKEDWYTLGLAAAHGGVTTIATMPNYGEGHSVINRERLERVIELSEKCIVDARFWAGLCPGNLENLGGMDHERVVGYKGFTTGFDPELTFPRDDKDFFKHLRYAIEQVKKTGKPSAWHCEDEGLFDVDAKSSGKPWAYADWRMPESEYEMAKQLIEYARGADARIHVCHSSVPATLSAVRSYELATTEVTWHHAIISKFRMKRDKRMKMNPPLRGRFETASMSKSLCHGLVPLCTDHAPHTLDEKMGDNPPGVPGLDTYGSLLAKMIANKDMTPKTAATVSSYMSAGLLGLYDRGDFNLGMRADFTVLRVDGLGRPMKIYSKCDWSPYDIEDYVEATIRGGKVLFRKGEPVGL